MNKLLVALLMAVGFAGGLPVQVQAQVQRPKKNVDQERLQGTTVLQPNYLNEKEAGFARPVKVTYSACIVDALMDNPTWERPVFDAACFKSDDELKFERGPLIRSGGQSVSGLGLTSTRLTPETKRLLAMEGVIKDTSNPAKPAAKTTPTVAARVSKPTIVRIDKSGFIASTLPQPTLSADCCGGSDLTPRTVTKKIRGALK